MMVYNDCIPTNQVQILPNFDLYEFGVMASCVHNLWSRIVNERSTCHKSCYAKSVTYNNFPWPSPTDRDKSRIERSGEKLLKVLLKYAQKYPVKELVSYWRFEIPELEEAYADNDEEVINAYRSSGWKSTDNFHTLLIKSYALADTVLMLDAKVFRGRLDTHWKDTGLFLSIKKYIGGSLSEEELVEAAKHYKKELKKLKRLRE